MNLLRSLRHRPFALLWSGQTASRLGDSLYRLALAWWVLEKTGLAKAMGTVLLFSSIPMLIFLLVGGVVTDHFPRLRIMFISDIGYGIAGWATDLIGAPLVFVIGGALTVLLALLGLLHPAIRNLD